MKKGKIILFVMTVCLFTYIFENELRAYEQGLDGVNEMQWNLLDSKEWFEDYIVCADNGLYVAKENYGALEFVEVEPGVMCAVHLPDCNNIHVVYYDVNKNYLSGDILSAPKGRLLEIPKECHYITISMARAEIRTSFFVQDGQNGVVLVSKEEGTQYSSVKSATASIKESGTVVVFPGIYKGNVQAWGKQVNIIGVDRETCIIENNSSSYSAPPLEIASGTIKNLTIRARGSNTEGNGAGNTEPGAYGVHIEDNALIDSSLKFENCYIYSDYNSAVGMGMRGGCRVQFVNTHLKGKEYGLFCHDSASKQYTGIQNLSIISCVIEGMQGSGAVRFDSQGVTGAQVNVLFINTDLRNKNVKTVASQNSDKLLSTRNNGGKGTQENWMRLKNYYLDENSCGNNILEMDY